MKSNYLHALLVSISISGTFSQFLIHLNLRWIYIDFLSSKTEYYQYLKENLYSFEYSVNINKFIYIIYWVLVINSWDTSITKL